MLLNGNDYSKLFPSRILDLLSFQWQLFLHPFNYILRPRAYNMVGEDSLTYTECVNTSLFAMAETLDTSKANENIIKGKGVLLETATKGC